MIADLAPAEVHLVATAREPLGLFTASWQESLKNRSTTPLPEYARGVAKSPNAIWNWRTLDLRLVLRRWARDGPPSTCTCCRCTAAAPARPSGRPSPASLGLDPAAYDTDLSFPNESMGVVEAETLRRVNEHLATFERAFDQGTYIRTFLADERLVPRGGERYWPEPDQVEECRRRGLQAVDFVREQGYDVLGDLDDLLVPDELERAPVGHVGHRRRGRGRRGPAGGADARRRA